MRVRARAGGVLIDSEEQLLTWLPVARTNRCAVLAVQSLGRSWGLRREDEMLADLVSLLLTLRHVLKNYPALDCRRVFVTVRSMACLWPKSGSWLLRSGSWRCHGPYCACCDRGCQTGEASAI